MSRPRMAPRLGAAVVAALVAMVMLVAPVPAATAASCPGAQLIFARGRLEPPGAGQIGNTLIGALRSRLPNKNIGLYAVNYAADADVINGANDMSGHIQYMANSCPDTRLVLGGYSLGAAVTDVVLAAPGPMFGFDNPLPPGIDQHISAVALFGNGSQWVGPITNFNPAYNDRTIELCHGDDPICNPADPKTWRNNWPQHLAPAYIDAGMVNQAADFVAGRL